MRARAPCPVDALLIACMHRLVHLRTPYYFEGVARYSADRLIWLYDIRLLAERFSEEDWKEFARRAIDKGLAGVCRDGLVCARTLLGAPCPPAALEALSRAGQEEVPSAYLRAGWLQRECMNLRAIPGVSGKLGFLAKVAFPPTDYMRSRYSGHGPGWLPWLYARRVFGGIMKRLRGRPTATDRT